MFRKSNCGSLALREYFYLYKGKLVQVRGDLFTFQDIINEAKVFFTFIPQKNLNLTDLCPCIVKFKEDHFVLVNSICNGEVYYVDNGLSCRIPLDDFYYNFKGYILSEKEDVSSQILKEEECLKIIGHKKGKDIFANIIPGIVGLVAGPFGPIIAGLAAAGSSALTQKFMSSSKTINPLTTVLSSLGAGIGAKAMAPGVTAAKEAGQGYMGQLWSGGRTLLGMQPSSASSAASLPSYATTAAASPYGIYGNPSNIAGYNPTLAESMASGGNLIYQTGKGWVKSPTETSTATQSGGGVLGSASNILSSKPGQIGMSLLSSGISSGVKLPEYDDSYLREISQRISGGSPLSNLATQRATEIISGQPLTKEDEQAILDIYNQREQESLVQTDKTYQQYGRLGSEEHKAARQKVVDYWNTQRAHGLRSARKDAQAMQNQILTSAWNYDQNQINELLTVAEQTGDINDIKWAIRAGDTAGVKSIFDKLAQLLWPSGSSNITSNLLGVA